LGLKTDYQLFSNENQSEHYVFSILMTKGVIGAYKLLCGSMNAIQELPVLAIWL
jgi:hypothetical protein